MPPDLLLSVTEKRIASIKPHLVYDTQDGEIGALFYPVDLGSQDSGHRLDDSDVDELRKRALSGGYLRRRLLSASK